MTLFSFYLFAHLSLPLRSKYNKKKQKQIDGNYRNYCQLVESGYNIVINDIFFFYSFFSIQIDSKRPVIVQNQIFMKVRDEFCSSFFSPILIDLILSIFFSIYFCSQYIFLVVVVVSLEYSNEFTSFFFNYYFLIHSFALQYFIYFRFYRFAAQN